MLHITLTPPPYSSSSALPNPASVPGPSSDEKRSYKNQREVFMAGIRNSVKEFVEEAGLNTEVQTPPSTPLRPVRLRKLCFEPTVNASTPAPIPPKGKSDGYEADEDEADTRSSSLPPKPTSTRQRVTDIVIATRSGWLSGHKS